MSKKKAMKVAVTSTIAASAFVLANPAQAATVSQAKDLVAKAQILANELRPYYNNPQFDLSTGLEEKHQEVRKAIRKAQEAIDSLSAGSEKASLQAGLDAANEHQLRAARIIDVARKGEAVLATRAALQAQIDEGAIDADLDAAYEAHSAAILEAERAIGKVPGAENRAKALDMFVTPAKITKETVIYEVSRYRLQADIDQLIANGELQKAEEEIAKLERLEQRSIEIKKKGNELHPGKYPELKEIEAQLQAGKEEVVKKYEDALTPQVKSVEAINAKQIEVKFNKALDRNTVTVDNFVVTQTGDAAGSDRLTGAGATNAIGTTNTGSAVLSADGKTVILTLNNDAGLANPTSVTVAVSANVKDTFGKAIEATTKTASFSDSSVPVAEKVETVGSNQFRVIFSEPVTTQADRAANDTGADADLNARAAFVVDNNAVAVTNVVRDPQNPKALLVTVSGNLSAGNHTVRVNPTGNALIQDYVGYAVVQTDLTYNHVADTNAPTFTAEARNERTVRLTFNKPVTIPASNNIAIRHSYDATGAVAVLADNTGGTITPVAGSNNTQYDVTFNTPLPVGQVPIYVSYVNNTGLTAANSVRDSFGNTLVSGTSATVTVTRDTVAPTVTNVNVVNATTIDVTFSEDVANATVATNYTLTNPQGNPVAVNNVVRQGTTNTYRLTVGSMAAGGNYTLSISNNITDTSVSANRLAPYTTTLAVGDLQAPTVGVNAVTINAARDRIYIEYSEPMATTGTYSAVDVNNYRTAVGASGAQSSLPIGTTITQNGNVVTIALPSALAGTQTHLVIGQVADAAGNKIAALQTERLMGDAAAGFTTTIDQVRVTDSETVTFRVGRHLRAVNASQIVVDRNPAADVTATSATFVNNADGTATVTAKFAANSFATDLNGIVDLDLGVSALTDINNLTSAAMANQALAADADRVAPALASIAAWNNRSTRTQDTDNDGQIDRIQVAFSEDLYVASVHESDFTVNGYTVTGVAVENNDVTHAVAGAGSVVTLTLQEKATPDTGVTPDVTLVGSVQDDSPQRNQLGAQSAVTSFDAAAPRIASITASNGTGTAGVIDSGDRIVITFTEAINPATITGLGITLDGTANDDADLLGVLAGPVTFDQVADSNVTLSGNTLTITLGTVGTFTGGEVFTPAAAIADSAGNVIAGTRALPAATDF